MFRKIIIFTVIFLVCFFTFFVFSNPIQVFNMPALGVDLNNLTRSSTVCEYRGDTINATGHLLDVSGEDSLTRSEEFSHSDWSVTSGVTVTDNAARGFDGTLTADQLTFTDVGYHYQKYNIAAIEGNTYTWSVWIWSPTKTTIGIRIASDNGEEAERSVILNTRLTRVSISITFSYAAGDHIACGLDNRVGSGGDGIAGSIYAWGGQLVENDFIIQGMGVYHKTEVVSKPRHNLAPTASPGMAYSSLQGNDGNRIQARTFDGATQYYQKAHHDNFNIFDQDHTLTFVFSRNVLQYGYLFLHGQLNVGGFYVSVTADGVFYGVYIKTGDSKTVSKSGVDDNYYHVAQVRRVGNLAQVFIDGSSGTVQDVDGYGIDGVYNFTLGLTNFSGEIAYFRLDAEALSDEELNYEAQLLMGMVPSVGGTSRQRYWDFTRSTIGTLQHSNGTISTMAVDVPRVGGPGGGLLAESQATNYLTVSQEFENAAWTKVRCTAVDNQIMSPDGRVTAAILHEDATAATYRYMHQGVSISNTLRTTISVFAKPISRNWILVRVGGTVLGYLGAYFDVSTGIIGTTIPGTVAAKIDPAAYGFYRCSIVFDPSVVEILTTQIFIAEDDNDVTFDGLDQDSLYIWQTDMTRTAYPVSPIHTGAGIVSRAADSITMSPSDAGLPLKIGNSYNAKKLTIEFDAKARWRDDVDIPSIKSMLEISGNVGTASVTRNRVVIYVYSNGKVYFNFRSDDSVSKYIASIVNVVPYDTWNTYRVYFDCSDMSNMDAWINGSNVGMTYSGCSGTSDVDFTNCLVRVGQDCNGVVIGDMYIRNLRIWVE